MTYTALAHHCAHLNLFRTLQRHSTRLCITKPAAGLMVAQQELSVYHAAPTRSSRVVWLLEELKVPYKAIPVDFPKQLFTPEFLEINPMGSIPYVIDGDIELGESVAIVYYLLDKYGADRSATAWQALAFFESTLAGKQVPYGMLALLYPDDKKDPVVAEYMKTGALQACDEVERRFFGDGREYVAGPEFTAADVVAGQCLFISKWLGFITAEKHPKTLAYLERIMQRPAFGRVFLPSKEA